MVGRWTDDFCFVSYNFLYDKNFSAKVIRKKKTDWDKKKRIDESIR